MTVATTTPDAPRGMNVLRAGLWTAQVVLAAIYGMAGTMKTFSLPEELVKAGMAWAADAPLWLIRFIGTAEMAGAVGLILPAVTRILPGLTPLAACGLAAIQILAGALHFSRGELSMLPVNAVLLALAVFVAWGRTAKAPIAPRT